MYFPIHTPAPFCMARKLCAFTGLGDVLKNPSQAYHQTFSPHKDTKDTEKKINLCELCGPIIIYRKYATEFIEQRPCIFKRKKGQPTAVPF